MKQLLNKLSYLLATGFYSGLSPIMPGTCGTLAAAIILYIINLNYPTFYPNYGVCFSIFVSLLAILVTKHALKENLFGDSEIKDPQRVVIDEFAGYYVTFLTLSSLNIYALFWGFIFFRLFDMTKPLFVKKAEQLPGAWGIVADDIVAGIFAALCLRGFLIFF